MTVIEEDSQEDSHGSMFRCFTSSDISSRFVASFTKNLPPPPHPFPGVSHCPPPPPPPAEAISVFFPSCIADRPPPPYGNTNI